MLRQIIILILCCYLPATVFAKNHLIEHKSLNDINMDFNYSGDVLYVLPKIKEYLPEIKLLKPLGKVVPIEINISLQGVKLSDIADAIMNQTNNQVGLIIDATNNTLRLNYTGALDTGTDALNESIKWQEGALPRPILKKDGIVRFPYGEYQPIVVCEPLHLCDIELQPGEGIQGVVIGDSERWNDGDQGIPIVYSGTEGNLTPHLVLKPSQSGLDTSLMVTTSKRTYMIELKSAQNAYVARAGFYYPQDIIKELNNNKSRNASSTFGINTNNNDNLNMPIINLAKVSYNYSIGSGDYSWRPTHVFDDGTSVYIQFPPSVSSNSLPGICVLVDGDDTNSHCEMVNFRFNQNFYIIDKLFKSAKLVNGYGDYTQTIMIDRNQGKKGFWARLFGGSD